MGEITPTTGSRKTERKLLLLSAIILGALFITLFGTLQKGFVDVDSRLKNGTMVNINDKNPGQLIKGLLEKGYYFEDKKDIALISTVVGRGSKSFKEPIDNVGELNKRRFFIDADEAFNKGGQNFKKRVLDSRELFVYTGVDYFNFKK
jgi:hypothetical protein